MQFPPEIHIKELLRFKSLPLLNIQCHWNDLHYFSLLLLSRPGDNGATSRAVQMALSQNSAELKQQLGDIFCIHWLAARWNLGLISCSGCNLVMVYFSTSEMKEMKPWPCLAIKLLNLETQCRSKQNAPETVNIQLCPSSLGFSLSMPF